MSLQICPRWPEQHDIIPLQSRGTRTPIYAQPEHVGTPIIFSDWSKTLDGDQPFYALPPPGFDAPNGPMDRIEGYCRVLRIFPRERIS
jgi:hypothetical protein